MSTSGRHDRMMALFDRLCDLPPAERDAELDRECADDPELRQRLDAMLAVDGMTDSLIDRGPGGQPMQELASSLMDDLEENRGAMPERIGVYRLLRKIGEGGMGIIYEAEQDTPRRRVAMKLLRPGMIGADLHKRFRHETHVLGQLQHPGIAHIHDAGFTEPTLGNQPYFVMEFIDGRPLDKYAGERSLDTRERMELLARVCDAVQHAHQKGIIHRDLKPSNVLVVAPESEMGTTTRPGTHGTTTRHDAIGQPKILDFGIARATDADMQAITIQTEIGQLIGTLAYMSPEQVMGNSANLDTRCDVYALGVMLYELLSGRRPLDLTGIHMTEAARIIRDHDPEPLGAIDRTLRGDIETIVAKALEKDRDRRYVSAAALAADIRRYLSDQPVEARPASALYQLRKFARRNRALVGGVGATLLTLVGGIILSTALMLESRRNATLARRLAYSANMQIAAEALEDANISLATRSLSMTPKELRGWEWDHLSSRVDQSLSTSPMPEGYFTTFYADDESTTPTVALIPELVGERRQQMRAWFLNRGDLHYIRSTGGRQVLWVRYGTPNGTIRDMATGKTTTVTCGELGLPAHHVFQVREDKDYGQSSLAISDSGHRMAYIQETEDESHLNIVDLNTGEIRTRPQHWMILHFSSNERWLIGFFRDNWIVWDAENGAELGRGTSQPIRTVTISDDGRFFAVATYGGIVTVWDTTTGAILGSVKAHKDQVSDIAFQPGDAPQLLASTGGDGQIILWNPRNLKRSGVLVGHRGGVYEVAFDPRGKRLVSCGYDDTIRTWDVSQRGGMDVLRGHAGYVYPVCVTPDGRRILSGGWDGHFGADHNLRLWDAESGDLIAAWGPPGAIVRDAVFVDQGRTLCVAFGKGLATYDMLTGARNMHFEREVTLTAAPHTTLVGIKSRHGQAYVWDWTQQSPPTMITSAAPTERGTGMAWSPDGRYLALGMDDHVHIRDGRDFRPITILSAHDDGIWSVAWSPNSLQLASTSVDRTARLWRVSDWHCDAVLTHSHAVLTAVFSPDGTRLATGGRDGLVRLWDPMTHDQMVQLAGHELYIKSLAYSPDGSWLVSGSGDHTCRIWSNEPPGVRAIARQERTALVAQLGPLVHGLLAELHDPAAVDAALSHNRKLEPRQREVARQILLAEVFGRPEEPL